jgi:hypothetical protein
MAERLTEQQSVQFIARLPRRSVCSAVRNFQGCRPPCHARARPRAHNTCLLCVNQSERVKE